MICKLYDLIPMLTLLRQLPVDDFVLSELQDGSLIATIITEDMEITYHLIELKGDEPCECCCKE